MNVLRKLYEKHFINKEVEAASELCVKTYKYIHKRKPTQDEISAFTYAYVLMNDDDFLKAILSKKE